MCNRGALFGHEPHSSGLYLLSSSSLQERSVQYWPAELLQTETYGSFSVEMTVERASAHYTYRDLHITDPEVQTSSPEQLPFLVSFPL